MAAIDSLLKRFGFVKLARYGLVLTPEGRIMSLRPAVLEDGLGGRIVGWPDGDLAAMELQEWEPARPAPASAVATRLAVAPRLMPMPKPAIVIAPAAPAVAPAPQVDEDDWEWEIALARARVAAEESEMVAAPQVRRARLDTIPPPAAKLAVVTIPVKAVEPMPDWPKTEPITTITVVAEAPLAREPKRTQPLAVVALPPKPVVVSMPTPAPARPGTAPPTIIPIPRLPSIKDRMAQIQPVVSSRPSAPRTRLAKGTGPVSGTHVGAPLPPPPIRAGEDETMPDLPAMARTVSLPRLPRS
jgi:hypothetical protein